MSNQITYLIVFLGCIHASFSWSQSVFDHIDTDNPTLNDCLFIDSVLSNPHQLSQSESQEYMLVLTEQLPEFDHQRLAIFYLDSLISIYSQRNQIKPLADAFYEKSMLHDHLGEYPQALSASQAALNNYKTIGDQSGIALSYNDIGVIHYYREEYEKAEEYLDLSGAIFSELKDTAGFAIYCNNLANVYFERGDGDRALELYEQGYLYDLEQNNLDGQCISLCNIGETHAYLGDFNLAEKKLLSALQIAEDIGDSWTLTVPLMSLGDLYQKTQEFHKANHVLSRCLAITREIEALAEEAETCRLLYEINKTQGNFKQALFYHELLRDLEDRMFNQDSERLMEEMEMEYQVEDKQQQIELLNKAAEIKQLTYEKSLDQKQNQQRILLFGLVIIVVILGFIFRGFVVKKKANAQLTKQNQIISGKNEQLHHAYEQIEEKNNEILDSIRYAKRIQSAILPAKSKMTDLFPDSFVLYLPKDVVAGDFYWLEQKDGKILFAVADCTGHGVPGAMVSVVCNNGLNRSVREHGLTDPGEILDQTRKIVLEEFEKSEEQVNDGMDIALCCLDGNQLHFAGAHNSLWLIKAGTFEILEIKGDKQPVGKFDHATNFTTHTVKVEAGDRIYLSSDGFADQFGGEKGKKMKTTNFKKLILSNIARSSNEQKVRLNDAFEEWKGSLEQIDDVCVMGIII